MVSFRGDTLRQGGRLIQPLRPGNTREKRALCRGLQGPEVTRAGWRVPASDRGSRRVCAGHWAGVQKPRGVGNGLLGVSAACFSGQVMALPGVQHHVSRPQVLSLA